VAVIDRFWVLARSGGGGRGAAPDTCAAPYRIVHIAPAITGCCNTVTLLPLLLLLLLLKVINCRPAASSLIARRMDFCPVGV